MKKDAAKHTIAICISPQLEKWLRENAKKNKRSLSSFTTLLIEQAKDSILKKNNGKIEGVI